MGGWNPWRTLCEREHIALEWEHLPAGLDAWWAPLAGGYAVIALAMQLSRRGRSCALSHELVHDERGLTTSDMPPALASKEEWHVERISASRLVPPDELAAVVRRIVDCGEGVTAEAIADEFDVTVDVARLALALLSASRRAPSCPVVPSVIQSFCEEG